MTHTWHRNLTLPLQIHATIYLHYQTAAQHVVLILVRTLLPFSCHPAQEAVRDAGLQSPTLLVIGEVVALSPGWALYQQSGACLQEPWRDWGNQGRALEDWLPEVPAGLR